MELLVLVGQRKQRYEGEYSLEALAVIDEIGDSDNPDYMRDELAKYTKTAEFDALAVVRLNVNDSAVRNVLYPAAKALRATVVS